MKICFAIDEFKQEFGGPYTAIKQITKQLKINKKKFLIVDKFNFSYKIEALHNYDIFHIFGGWTPFYIKLNKLALRLKKKIIIHPSGFYEPWSLRQKQIKKTLAWHLYQKKLLLSADIIHCASESEEKNLLKLNSNFKTRVIPFGIEDEFINKKINYKKINKKVLFFSRIHKKKGIYDLVKAWNEIGNKEWTLNIVANKNDFNLLTKYISNKKLKINAIKPFFNNKKKIHIFDNYDVLALPTKNENFGIVILESLSRGLPVLTSNLTPWNIIQDNNAGWIINDSYLELKLILFKIFNTKYNDFLIKKKNAIKIAKKYNWDKLFKLYLDLYSELLKTNILIR